MLYANFEDYTKYSTYGKITQEEFEKLADEASRRMEYVTRDRIIQAVATSTNELQLERIRRCCVALVDFLFASSKFIVEGKGMVSGESVDRWRVSYQIPDHLSPRNPDRAMYNICQTWLVRPENLMFVGG